MNMFHPDFSKNLAKYIETKIPNIDVFDLRTAIEEYVASQPSTSQPINKPPVAPRQPVQTTLTTPTPKVETPKSVSPARSATSSTAKTVCCASIKGKDGDRECGVGAKFDIDGKPYCKRHYDANLKKKVNSEVVLTPPPSRQTTTLKDSPVEQVVQKKVQEVAPILQKVSMKKELDFYDVGNGKFIDKETRILFDRKYPHEAYGVLHSDNSTILPFGTDHIRFLETHNLKFRYTKEEAVVQSKSHSDNIKKCEDEEILNADECGEEVVEEVEEVVEEEELNAEEEEGEEVGEEEVEEEEEEEAEEEEEEEGEEAGEDE